MKLLIIFASLFLLCEGQNVEIHCNFTSEIVDFYTCQAQTFLISPNNTQNVIIVGDHLPNQTNIDVNGVRIYNQPLPFIITEFFTIFPNLSSLIIFGGLLKIQEDAFKFTNHLENLVIWDSPIRVLPAYAIDGAYILRSFGIVQCELETIDENAYVGLININRIHISSSNLRFLPEDIFRTLYDLSSVEIFANKIATLPARLFRNNFKLNSIRFENNNINALAKGFVDYLADMLNLQTFFFTGNSCGNSTWHPAVIDEIHSALQQCYVNYEQRRHFSLNFQGSLIIRDENGIVILEV